MGRLRDPRIRYERFAANVGQAGNFNRCLALARGEFWTLLSADDRLAPGFLEHALAVLDRHPELDFCVTGSTIIDHLSCQIGERRPWPTDRPLQREEAAEELLRGAAVNLLCLLVRRATASGLGGFRTDLTWGLDWDWILRLTERCDGWYAAALFGDYRVHPQSGTEQVLRQGSNGPQELRILREALDRQRASRAPRRGRGAMRQFALRQLFFADQTLRAGRRGPALANLVYALRADRWVLSRVTFWALLAGCVLPALLGPLGRLRSGRPSALAGTTPLAATSQSDRERNSRVPARKGRHGSL